MYEVIRDFTDLQDNEYPYSVGDLFPHDGLEVSEERIKELSGSNNRQHKPLIRQIEDTPPSFSNNSKANDKQYTKTEINRMTTAELQDLAANKGIENAYEMTGGELKKALIEHFGL